MFDGKSNSVLLLIIGDGYQGARFYLKFTDQSVNLELSIQMALYEFLAEMGVPIAVDRIDWENYFWRRALLQPFDFSAT